jgi:copper oxidase (laccase) domain-containing protein
VGEDVAHNFTEYDSSINKTNNGRYMLDLWKITRSQLLRAGLKDKNILNPGLCTVCRNDLFFSYRAEGESAGRMMSITLMTGN